jgi:hypothetical protein
MCYEDCQCSYFTPPVLADFSCGHWNAESAALAVFLLHLALFLPPLESGKNKTLKKDQEKVRKKKISIGQQQGEESAE